MAVCSIGTLAKFIVQGGKAPRSFTNSSERLFMIQEDISAIHRWGGRMRGVGELGRTNDAHRQTQVLSFGKVLAPASPEDMHRWLPRVMWGDATDTTYELGFRPVTFDMMVDREAEIFRYEECYVDKLSLISSASNGGNSKEMMDMEIQVVGTGEKTESWPDPGPDLPEGLNFMPYMHWEGEFIVGGVTICLESLNLSIDNKLKPVGFNRLSPFCFRSTGRDIFISGTGNLASDTVSLAMDIINSPQDGTLTLSHLLAPMSCVFDFKNLRNIQWRTPNVQDPQVIPLEFAFTATKSTGDELIVTNDHTP